MIHCCVASGWHNANEITSGNFTGNYNFLNNLGIGIDNPTCSLDVNGKIKSLHTNSSDSNNTVVTKSYVDDMFKIELNGESPAFLKKIEANDKEEGDYFGASVSISGDRIIIGAYGEDTGSSNAGAAYIYDSNGNFIKKIQASDKQADDYFGWSVNINSDRIIVGAHREDTGGESTGAAYIYDSNGNFIKKIQAPDKEMGDYFGYSVSISGDRIIVGASYEDTGGESTGAAYIYDSNGNYIKKIQAPDKEAGDTFGRAVDINGNRTIIGAHDEDTGGSKTRAVYIYDNNGNFIKKIQAPDKETEDTFGWSLDISANRIIVSSPLEDTGGEDAGAVYIYDTNGNFIKKIQAHDKKAGDLFGRSVSTSGNRIVIGASFEDTVADNAGAIYIYDIDGNFIKKILPTVNQNFLLFGLKTSISGDRIVAGTYQDDTFANDAGSAYIYHNVADNILDILKAEYGKD